MNFISPKLFGLGRWVRGALLCGFLVLPLNAQFNPQLNPDETPEAAVSKAVTLMQNGQWAEAKAAFDRIISIWGSDQYYKNFPPFGTVYYNKGYCEMQLKDYSDAASSFETCFTNFKSRPPTAEDPAGGTNVYEKLAVFQWGAAEQAQDNFEEAINLYKKFTSLNPSPRVDQFELWAYLVRLGTCYARIGDLPHAEENIGRAIRERDSLGAPIAALWTGAIEVLEAYSAQEDADADGRKAVAFIETYVQPLQANELATALFAERLLKLAQGAVKADKTLLGLSLIRLVPKTEEIELAAETYRATSAETRVLEHWKAEAAKGEPKEIHTYFGIAQLYQNSQANRGAYVVYDHMADHYHKTKHRPTILYGATKMASEIGEMDDVQKHGLKFLAEFPEHEYAPSVSSLLLSSLFFNGRYERCLEIAADVRQDLAPGSKERDLPDFVYGGSLYYLGRYQEAQPEIDNHVERYPQSVYIEYSSYYQGSNLIKLFEWQRASELLDKWLEKYEPQESPLLDVAWLDRATCHFALATTENKGNEKARELVGKIRSRYPDSPIVDRALALLGDIEQNEGMYAKAEGTYTEALLLAERREHEVTAATCLMQLVTVAAAQGDDDPKKHEDAIAYYEKFFQIYPDSFYAPNAAVAALPAFKEAAPARLDDALQRVQKLIVEMGANRDADSVERTLNAYTAFLLKEKSAEEVVAILDNFPNELGLRTLDAWLLITKIGIIEERLNDVPRMQAKARVYYDYLETDFDKSELSDYILYQLGTKIAQTNPFKARAWFEAVARSSDPDLAQQGEMQLAIIDAKSSDSGTQLQAVQTLQRIRENVKGQDPEMEGLITLTLGRLFHEQERWEEANKEWIAYQEKKAFRTARPEALFKLGESYLKLGKTQEAKHVFSQITVLYAAFLDLSTEAVLNVAQILWSEGKHEQAFRFVNTFHYRMQENDHSGVAKMDALKSEYMAQLKAKGKWKESLADVRQSFGRITPEAK